MDNIIGNRADISKWMNESKLCKTVLRQKELSQGNAVDN